MLKKTNLLLFAILAMVLFPLQAQKTITDSRREEPRGEYQQEFLEKKLSYFKEKLMLNKKEAEQFEEVYTGYMKRKRELHKRYNKAVMHRLRKGNIEELSAEEKEKLIDVKMDIDAQRCELNRSYTKKLRKVLPAEKVLRYFKLDREFNRKMKGRKRENIRNRRGRVQNARTGRNMPGARKQPHRRK